MSSLAAGFAIFRATIGAINTAENQRFASHTCPWRFHYPPYGIVCIAY